MFGWSFMVNYFPTFAVFLGLVHSNASVKIDELI